MHEMALAMGLIEIVENERRTAPFSRVRRLRLEIGMLSHVDPRALEFGFSSASKGTVAQGALMEIKAKAGSAFCVPCAENVAVDARGQACPRCGGHQWLLIEGDEMRLIDMEVE